MEFINSESGFTSLIHDTIFKSLTEREIELLKKNSYCIAYKKGETIFKEGDLFGDLQLLTSGKVKIFKEGIGGREQIIRLAKPIGFIGYRSFFAQEPHNTTAVTIENSIITSISNLIFYEILQNNHQITLSLFKSFATELGLSYNRTIALTQKHIRGRLAESLIFIKETYGVEEDGCTLFINLTREELANLSNMTTSNAIRTLTSFSSEGVIAIEGKKIKILDYDKLQKISRLG